MLPQCHKTVCVLHTPKDCNLVSRYDWWSLYTGKWCFTVQSNMLFRLYTHTLIQYIHSLMFTGFFCIFFFLRKSTTTSLVLLVLRSLLDSLYYTSPCLTQICMVIVLLIICMYVVHSQQDQAVVHLCLLHCFTLWDKVAECIVLKAL